jgi:hypothetical protein
MMEIYVNNKFNIKNKIAPAFDGGFFILEKNTNIDNHSNDIYKKYYKSCKYL